MRSETFFSAQRNLHLTEIHQQITDRIHRKEMLRIMMNEKSYSFKSLCTGPAFWHTSLTYGIGGH